METRIAPMKSPVANLSLRRSIVGSLKSNRARIPREISSLSPSPSPVSSPLPSPPFSVTPTTPDFLRNGTPDSIRHGLRVIEEAPPPPEFERDIDLIVSSGFSEDATVVFGEVRPPASDSHPVFDLPAAVRRNIYSYCFKEETRTISLSPRFATKAVFEDGHFASPWDVLDPVSGALGAFRILRHDILAYFWTQYHFHVTLSMFSGPKFSPLSHVWLTDYLDIIQHLTVEVDLTRLGGSAMMEAPVFGHNLTKLETLLCGTLNGLSSRGDAQDMAELNLLCRRYAGFRPYDEYNVESEVPYVPEYFIYVCDAITNLRGILKQCRISGFGQDYTKLLLGAMFGNPGETPECVYPDERAWPPVPYRPTSPRYGEKTPIQTPVSSCSFELTPNMAEDFEKSYPPTYTRQPPKIKLMEDDSSMISSSSGSSVLNRLRSMGRRMSARGGSLLINETMPPTNMSSMLKYEKSLDEQSDGDSESKSIEESLDLIDDMIPLSYIPSQSGLNINFHEPVYGEPEDESAERTPILVEQPIPPCQLPSLSEFGVSFDRPPDRTLETKSSNENPDTPRLLAPNTNTHRCLTPTSSSTVKLTPSPNTMNNINEKDPAFQRTVSALYSPGPDYTAPNSNARPRSYTPIGTKMERDPLPDRAKSSRETRRKSFFRIG